MTQVSRSTFATNLETLIPDNNSSEVSPADVRSVIDDLADSVSWADESELADDLTPSLSGDLNVNGFSIASSSNTNITLAPGGTGDIVLGTIVIDGDTAVGEPQDGYSLAYNHSLGKFVPTAIVGGGGSTQLSDLTDVGVTTPTNRNLLVADGNSWEARPLTEEDISDFGTYLTDLSTSVLGDLSDVSISSVAQGDVLYRGPAGWVNLGAGTSGQFLQTLGVGTNPQWATPAGSGNVSNTGTPLDNQIAVWTAATTVEGTTGLTYNGSSLNVTGNIAVSGTVDGRDVFTDGAKLDTIATGATVTNATNVQTAIEAITLTAVTPAAGDEFLVVDASDNALKSVLFSSLFSAVVQDATPQLGGDLDINGNDLVFAGGSVNDVTGSDPLIVTGTAGSTGDLAIWNIDGDLVDGPTPPAGTIIGTTDTQTLTNKTINGDNNTISNINLGQEANWAVISDVADASAFEAGDKVLIFEAGVGMRKVDYSALPSGGGGAASSGSGAPVSTPGTLGSIYIDTTADEAYIATGTASSADWGGAVLTEGGVATLTSATITTADALLFGDDSDSDNAKQTTVANFIADLGILTTAGVTTDGTTARVLALTDVNDVVLMSSASSNTVTIPTNATVAFPVGSIITVVSTGAGTTSIVAAGTVTLQGNGGSATAGSCDIQTQYGACTLIKFGTDTWGVSGDIDTVA